MPWARARPTVLARYAGAQTRAGRRVGGHLNIRDMREHCQQHKGLLVERLDHYDQDEECWREEAAMRNSVRLSSSLSFSPVGRPAKGGL